ncbi:MAG: hypothetical protein OEV76_08455 [Anaerolineae bacterium]|nr:hypothetical protein [Anaerolineae bacterium]
MTKPTCPYCNQTLDKTPKRKTKCPHCGNDIYVRSLPSGDHQKALLTEQGAKEVEKEWERVQFKKKWMQSLEGYGLSEQDFDRQGETLRERFRQEPGDGDVIWSMFNEALHRAMKGSDSQQLKMLYFDMALFLYEEGRAFFDILQQSRKMELTGFKEAGWAEKVFVITAGDASCEVCQKLAGKVFKLDQALDEMPIPNKACTHALLPGKPGWCRCLYGVVTD